MRVLICPRRFDGTLTAVQAAEAMASGWRAWAPDDELTLAPLADDGTGFLTAVEAALGGVYVAVTVSDPLGRAVPAQLLLCDVDGVRTAYVEAAQAVGLHLLGADERNPCITGSYGVGELVAAAVEEGARRIVVALGDTATNDAGAGLLAALGAGPGPALASGGGALAEVGVEDLHGLGDARARLHGIDLVAATQESVTLTGFDGCSAVTAAAKGATREQTQQLEGAIGRFAEVVARVAPAPTDLLSGAPRRLEREPGAGAGGGLAYAMALLGGRRASAVGIVLDAWRFDELVRRHDVVLTGEGSFDWQSLRDSVPSGVADVAARYGRPTVVLAGQVEVGRRELMAAGVSGAYAVAATEDGVVAAMADPVGTLEARARRVATTWSPR